MASHINKEVVQLKCHWSCLHNEDLGNFDHHSLKTFAILLIEAPLIWGTPNNPPLKVLTKLLEGR
jgi:hypothetical protein